mmetsp:Transcript_9895/g.22733  ORF Transcript_9895/g.22733 Transcript_9895/m.22733 type:complete len:232 (-) Transcript_9895:1134-1829(-)
MVWSLERLASGTSVSSALEDMRCLSIGRGATAGTAPASVAAPPPPPPPKNPVSSSSTASVFWRRVRRLNCGSSAGSAAGGSDGGASGSGAAALVGDSGMVSSAIPSSFLKLACGTSDSSDLEDCRCLSIGRGTIPPAMLGCFINDLPRGAAPRLGGAPPLGAGAAGASSPPAPPKNPVSSSSTASVFWRSVRRLNCVSSGGAGSVGGGEGAATGFGGSAAARPKRLVDDSR